MCGVVSGVTRAARIGMAGASTVLMFGALLGACAPPASASVRTDAQAAAHLAVGKGYRTCIAVLDLRTGAYTGAAEATEEFASESVVKVLIATELLATGQMHGDVERTAYRMITQSDDEAANALYGLAGRQRSARPGGLALRHPTPGIAAQPALVVG